MMNSAESETPINGRKTPSINSIFNAPPKFPSSRRTPSISSNSSSSSTSTSFRSSSPPPSPTTPLHRFTAGGIPFSWETIPGIPKKQILKKIDSCRNHKYLPLPPVSAPVSAPASHRRRPCSRGDPFFAALVECSKGGDDDGDDKAVFGRRILGDRFRFVNNMSCKNFSTITESLVLLPRGPRRIDYDVAKKRSG